MIENDFAGLELFYKRAKEKLVELLRDPYEIENVRKAFKDAGFLEDPDEVNISLIRALDTLYEGLTSDIGLPTLDNVEMLKKACSLLLMEGDMTISDMEFKLKKEVEKPLYAPIYSEDPLGVSEEVFDHLTKTFVTLYNIRGIL
jgi:hypothetical protein